MKKLLFAVAVCLATFVHAGDRPTLKEAVDQVRAAIPSKPGDDLALMIQPDIVVGGQPDSNNILETVYLSSEQEEMLNTLRGKPESGLPPYAGCLTNSVLDVDTNPGWVFEWLSIAGGSITNNQPGPNDWTGSLIMSGTACTNLTGPGVSLDWFYTNNLANPCPSKTELAVVWVYWNTPIQTCCQSPHTQIDLYSALNVTNVHYELFWSGTGCVISECDASASCSPQ